MEGLRCLCKKTLDKLKDKSGTGVIEAAMIFIFAMFLLSITYEFIRVQITAYNIRDSYERAILTVGSENYNEVYSGFREDNYIGGEFEGGPYGRKNLDDIPEWEALNDYGNIEEELMELLTLTKEENTLMSEKDGYSLSDIQVMVNNAEYAASGKYQIKGTVNVKIPIYLSRIKILDISLPIVVTTAYTPKY